MSLPWRHATIDDYLHDTLTQLQKKSSNLKRLNIGNYFLHGQATTQLNSNQLISILQLVPSNLQLEELYLCGIYIPSNSSNTHSSSSTVLQSLRCSLLRRCQEEEDDSTRPNEHEQPQHPSTTRRNWNKISFSSCRGQGIQALSSSTTTLPLIFDDDDDHVDDHNNHDKRNTVTTTPVVNVHILHIAKCQLNHLDYNALGKFLQQCTTLQRFTVIEEDLAQATATLFAMMAQTTTASRTITPWSSSLARKTCSLEVLELWECQLQDDVVNNHDDNNDTNQHQDMTVDEENHNHHHQQQQQQEERQQQSIFLQDLAQGLAQNTSLTTIGLQGCELEDDTLACLIRNGRLLHHPRLQRILLLRNHCGDQGLAVLAQLVARTTTINISTEQEGKPLVEELRPPATTPTPTTPTSSALTANTAIPSTEPPPPPTQLQLKQLDLSNQHLDRRGERDKLTISHSFASALANPNCTLSSLILKFNKLNDEDATRLAHGLRYNNGMLEELDLRSNCISDIGIIALASTLHNNNNNNNNNRRRHYNTLLPSSSSHHLGLIKLYLFGNSFGDEGAKALWNAIQQNSTLTTLNLQYSSCWYREIQYYICLNTVGRKLLQDQYNNSNDIENHNAPSSFVPGLWPYVLTRADRISSNISRGICTGPDSLFYFLVRGGPAVMFGTRTFSQ